MISGCQFFLLHIKNNGRSAINQMILCASFLSFYNCDGHLCNISNGFKEKKS